MIPAISTTLSPAQVQSAWKTAQKFEAMALNEFLKPMFGTVDLAHSLFGGGEAEEQWQPFMVEALATKISDAGGIGLAAPVFTQMIHMQEAKDAEQ